MKPAARPSPQPVDPLGQSPFAPSGPVPRKVAPRAAAASADLNRWVIISIVGGAAFVLLFVVVYSAWSWLSGQFEDVQGFAQGTRAAEESARESIEMELARIRSAGEPVTPQDLESYYALRPGAIDTTKLWSAGSDAFYTDAFNADAAGIPIADSSQGYVIPPPGQAWPELPRAQQLLFKYRNHLEQLHEAARRQGSARYATRFQDGIRMELPQVAELMAAARVLRLEVQVRAHEGDLVGAVESVSTIFAAGKTLETYPNFVAQLVCWSTYGNGFSALEYLLPQVRLSDSELLRLGETLDTSNAEEGLHRALVGERVLGLEALQNPDEFLATLTTDVVEEERRLTQQEAQGFARVVPLVKERDTWFFLRHMRGLVEAAGKPWPQRLTAADQLHRQWDALGQQNRLRKEDFASLQEAAEADRAMLAHLLVPDLRVSFESHARFIALRDLTRTAIAIERYRGRHGEPPGTLQQLGTEFLKSIPIDPFSGKPLQYARDANRYRVYSVGMDRKDDQGKGSLAATDEDIVFAVPLVAQLTSSQLVALRASPSDQPLAGSLPQASPSSPRSAGNQGRPGFTTDPIGAPIGRAAQDTAPAGRYLVGLRIIKGPNWGGVLHAIQPIYRVGSETREGRLLGGTTGSDRYEAIARPGYAVGGIRVRRGAVIDAIQLIFYRIDGGRMDKQDRYESQWLGGEGGTGTSFVEFGGSFITGISVTFRDDVTSIQLHPGQP